MNYKNDYNDDDLDFFENSQMANQKDNNVTSLDMSESDEDFERVIMDIDLSSFVGRQDKFKSKFSKLKRKINERSGYKGRVSLIPKKPLSKSVGIVEKAKILGRSGKKMQRVLVPNDRPVIIESVNKFMLSDKPHDNSIRNIGYYNGKKLNELILIINNDSAIDFNVSLFNPSMMLDYLQSTGQNLNNKIQVAGGDVLYSDVMYNILGNPMIIRNAKFVLTGPSAVAQQGISLQIQDKYSNGVTEVVPLNLALQIDTMQVEGNTISFDIAATINRAFIPDGMDVIGYQVLAGNTVTMCFYYEQKSLKKLMYKEARIKKVGPKV